MKLKIETQLNTEGLRPRDTNVVLTDIIKQLATLLGQQLNDYENELKSKKYTISLSLEDK